ncbi:MAG: hypothetical protein IE928_09875, partial [Gammaproteobacteria bacterium]|nr:hypothetical protein [Gammaproteobacteria bacterium]
MSQSGENLQAQSVADEDEIDLRELWQHIVDGKGLILAVTFACFVSAFGYAVSATSWFEAKATLIDNSAGGGKAGGALAGLGGLASLAGVSMPASPVEAVLATATSDAFMIDFLRKHDLKKVFMAGRWDAARQQWLPASGLMHSLWEEGARPYIMGERPKVNSPFPLAENEPTWQSTVEFLEKKNIFSISQDKKSNIVTMSVTWTDPNQAAQWVQWWVDDLNDLIRQRAIAESQSMLDNLLPKLEQPMPAEVRASVIGMIDEQTKTINAAMVKKDYALRLIDPPLAPETVAKPRRMLILAVAIVLGLMLGSMIAIIRG